MQGILLDFSEAEPPGPNGAFFSYDDGALAIGDDPSAPMVILDPKGEIVRDVGGLLEKKGYEVRVPVSYTHLAGTNVQDRLIAIHNLDCPWRPSDLEQRLSLIHI